jgi:hypothetical protein
MERTAIRYTSRNDKTRTSLNPRDNVHRIMKRAKHINMPNDEVM